MEAWARVMSACFRSAAKVLDEGGLPHLLLRLLQKLCAPVGEFGSVIFLSRELDQELPEPEPAPCLTLREASPTDIRYLLGASHPSRLTEVLLERFRCGDFCFVAIDADGMVAHSCWATTRPAEIPELARMVLLTPEEIYLYDAYTRPDLRQRGIFSLILSFSLRRLRAAGFKRAYLYVRADNPLSLRAVKRWLRPAARVWFLRLDSLRPLVLGWRRLRLPRLTKGIAHDGRGF